MTGQRIDSTYARYKQHQNIQKKHKISANAVKLSYIYAFRNGTETLLHKIFAFGAIILTFGAIELLMTQIQGLKLDIRLTRVKSLSVLEE